MYPQVHHTKCIPLLSNMIFLKLYHELMKDYFVTNGIQGFNLMCCTIYNFIWQFALTVKTKSSKLSDSYTEFLEHLSCVDFLPKSAIVLQSKVALVSNEWTEYSFLQISWLTIVYIMLQDKHIHHKSKSCTSMSKEVMQFPLSFSIVTLNNMDTLSQTITWYLLYLSLTTQILHSWNIYIKVQCWISLGFPFITN